MVKKLGILAIILVVVAATSLVWAGGPAAPCGPKKLHTTIQVKMKYPKPPMPAGAACAPMPQKVAAAGCYGEMGQAQQPPIPVAVPMWKFIVPWPPYVYYLPVE
jgi:hypothetical protein